MSVSPHYTLSAIWGDKSPPRLKGPGKNLEPSIFCTAHLVSLRPNLSLRLRPGENDWHCLPDMSLSLLACFTTTKFFKHFMFVKHVLHVSKQMFLIQIKNIFACRQANVGSSMHACQFRHADLVAGKTGKQSDKAPNSDFRQIVLAVSSGL